MPKCPLGNIGDNVNYCMFAYNNMKKQLELDLKEAMNDKLWEKRQIVYRHWK